MPFGCSDPKAFSKIAIATRLSSYSHLPALNNNPALWGQEPATAADAVRIRVKGPTPIFLAMQRHISHIKRMARGPSGRIVIDAGEELKNRLYTALAYQGIRVKEWFCRADEATIE